MESHEEMIMKGAGTIFKEVMAAYFLKMMSDINLQVHEAL